MIASDLAAKEREEKIETLDLHFIIFLVWKRVEASIMTTIFLNLYIVHSFRL